MESGIGGQLRSVVNLIDRLRDIHLEEYIQLPKIVVVGSQRRDVTVESKTDNETKNSETQNKTSDKAGLFNNLFGLGKKKD